MITGRRGFLRALAAVGAGIALRPIPVPGASYSVLEAPVMVPVPGPRHTSLMAAVRGAGATLGSTAPERGLLALFERPAPYRLVMREQDWRLIAGALRTHGYDPYQARVAWRQAVSGREDVPEDVLAPAGRLWGVDVVIA